MMSDDVPDEIHRLHQALLTAEGSLEPRMARLNQRLGLLQPRCLVPYRTLASSTCLPVHGRLLASSAPVARADDRWWQHLAHTYRRWSTRELPGVEVVLSLDDQRVRTHTDDEGDYRVELSASAPSDGLRWWEVTASVAGDRPLVATHRVLQTGRDAQHLVISDIDDTIIHTGATSVVQMAWRSLAQSAHRRLALPGIRPLYRALVHGPDGERARNPLAFVSSSPRNLYDLLVDFLLLHDVPEAPLLLRDVGLDETKIVKSRGHGHKLDRVEELMAALPDLPVILLGDTGQHDAALYAEAVARHGRRVRAVYLRDVDPERRSRRDEVADAHGAAIREAGVRYVRGGSLAFAEDALEAGWISRAQRDAVAKE